eukprot:13332838-Alexandrium_andersonii.AAC.1
MKQPKGFMLENVPGIIQGKSRKFMQEFAAELRGIKNSQGEPAYRVDLDVLSTKDYGIPQNRS